jgi:hypothetical protein
MHPTTNAANPVACLCEQAFLAGRGNKSRIAGQVLKYHIQNNEVKCPLPNDGMTANPCTAFKQRMATVILPG